MKKEEKTPAKTSKEQGNRFKPGQSGNPQGRPSGSRHKTTLAAQALLDGEAEALTRVCVEKALEGEGFALKLVLERILPPRRDRPITVDLPAIKNAEDIVRATGKIIEAVGMGTLTPGEGELVSKILETHRRAVETTELEKRIVELERRKG
jgi:hypothetical protein